MRLRASNRLHRLRALASALRLTKVVDQGSERFETTCPVFRRNDILGEIFESLGDFPAAPDSSGPANDERDRADLSISSTSTFQVVPRESLNDPGHRGEGQVRERDELDIFLTENMVRDAPDSGLAEGCSMMEADGALVRLPDSANSGESGGDDLSEVERILRADSHQHPGTEMTSGDERDRAASQALESSGVLTDEVLLQGLTTPRALSRVVEGSEPPSGGSANEGTRSPQGSVERAMRALPDFIGMPEMRLEMSAVALDPTAGISFGESFARALYDHPEPGPHEDRERARSRSKSGDGRGRDSAEGTPSKRQRSLSSTPHQSPDAVSVRDQIAALADTPSEATTMRSIVMETGTAARGLRSIERERSPARAAMEIEIGTPVRGVFEGSPLDDRDDQGRIRDEVMRDPEKIYEEIRRIMRVVEELKTTVDLGLVCAINLISNLFQSLRSSDRNGGPRPGNFRA